MNCDIILMERLGLPNSESCSFAKHHNASQKYKTLTVILRTVNSRERSWPLKLKTSLKFSIRYIYEETWIRTRE